MHTACKGCCVPEQAKMNSLGGIQPQQAAPAPVRLLMASALKLPADSTPDVLACALQGNNLFGLKNTLFKLCKAKVKIIGV